jgi:hypothetical protein
MKFYTYNYLRLDGSPFYIGKGNGNRAYVSHKTQGISTPKDRSRIKVQHWADETIAIAYEIYQIDFWGRKDIGTGILHNKTDGGGGISGFKNPHTEEWNRKISEAHMGKVVPQELREQIRAKLKGRVVPPERIAKQAAAQVGRKHSVAARANMRTAQRALGKKCTQEAKEYLSVVVKAQWEDPEYREKQSKAHSKPWTQKRRDAFDRRKAQNAGN